MMRPARCPPPRSNPRPTGEGLLLTPKASLVELVVDLRGESTQLVRLHRKSSARLEYLTARPVPAGRNASLRKGTLGRRSGGPMSSSTSVLNGRWALDEFTYPFGKEHPERLKRIQNATSPQTKTQDPRGWQSLVTRWHMATALPLQQCRGLRTLGREGVHCNIGPVLVSWPLLACSCRGAWGFARVET